MSLSMQVEDTQRQPIEYTVSLNAPQTQMVDIRMVIRNVAGPMMDVAMPVWRPGRYEVLNPAGGVRDVRAVTSAGRLLPIVKTDKTTWHITTSTSNSPIRSTTAGPSLTATNSCRAASNYSALRKSPTTSAGVWKTG